jgi:2-polyprenyl-3-methyl-5-hydroxy-6-metoxy-1,4-benzoquinol methylase
LSETISYYDSNAEKFFRDTVNVDMEPLHKPFLALIPLGGSILDAGCGSGRDALRFLQSGFHVEAFDASAEMCALASKLTGLNVAHQRFDQIQYASQFDGIWACASVLHVARDETLPVIERLATALRPGGVIFLSFKNRDEVWSAGGREFTGYTSESFRQLLHGQESLSEIHMWTTDDVRPDRNETWLNALLRREH